ncbi:MAG: peptide-methionine (S)-S-oxide reductase [Candidatus Colwellbacteria bacterium RIFCSPLOWO2_01_FULL_48_10]|uniref:Peptide methionine sulfoxide reductase MsrA n=1 Tax=Candidatus Colwellbacteria bacterium RIFCSPLOWO2_01_FULL_48_10 TaxID=1797690 RepID=A0A1G1Z4K9_9BACT|nr:MAG: peptide-methionine (S)-S-oxide reductase [Candidatus Colwellbacteria bacterium RIFCSPLOWO2_01_FULL_48_10]
MTQTTVFGGGCFWCTEAVFSSLKGVVSVMPGYAGGHDYKRETGGGERSRTTGGSSASPTYEQIHTGATGHAEVVKIDFDPAVIKYEDLLTVFFATHDPTTPNRQGNDVGAEYRSLILYSNDEQREKVEKFIARLNENGPKVVTEVKPLGQFYEAEEYHRNYYEKNASQPYCQLVISPKLDKLKARFSELLKTSRQ